MNLRVLATGSRGNCYVLRDNGACLLLDVGIEAGKIFSGLGQKPETVLGALITHQHKDHSRAVDELWRRGVALYGGIDTAKAIPWLKTSTSAHRIGWFTCKAFPVEHCHPNGDLCPNVGWLITNENTHERMVYVTDFCQLQNTIPGIHYWLIECNYMDELTANTNPYLLKRLAKSHMSLSRLIEVFKANDLSTCKQIVLCHGSKERLDPMRAALAVEKATRKPTVVAAAGLAVPLELEPY